jgi:thymidylate kinase
MTVPELSAAVEAESLLGRAFALFDDAGLSWCLLRERGVEAHGDVDVLVARRDFRRAAGALVVAGFVELPSIGRGSHRFFLGFDEHRGEWVELDVVTELAYGPAFVVRTDLASSCLRRARRHNGLRLLHRDDAFWTLFLHCALDRRTFSGRHEAELFALAGSATIEGVVGREVAAMGRSGWFAQAVIAAARERRTDLLEILGREFRSVSLRGCRRSIFVARAGEPFLRIVERAEVLRRRRGIRVAFLGVDGAGKSTLIRAVRERFVFPARSIYMGLWNADPLFERIPAGGLIRASVRPLTLWWRYARSVWHRNAGRLVLFDRYTYDALLPPKPPFLRLKRAYFAVIARSLPAPDLVLLLDAPPAIVTARKPGPESSEVEGQRQALHALRRRLRNVTVLDTSREQSAATREALALIWRSYRDRWGGDRS